MKWATIIAIGILCSGLIMVVADFLVKKPPCIDTYPPRSCAVIIPWLTVLGSTAIVLGALLIVKIGTRRAGHL